MSHPLRERNFRLLLVSRSMSTLSDALVPTALTLAIVQVTGSAAAIAVVLGCALGTRLALFPFAGVVADRFNTRVVSLCADVARVLTQALVGVELLTGHPDLTVIAIAQAVAGAASATSLSCLSPLVAGAVTGDGRAQANSLMGVAKSTSLVAGPALAALLIFSVGTGWVFVLDAAAFGVSALMLGLARIERGPARRASMASDLVRGWREVWARDWYWTSLIAHAVWNFAANLLLTLGPLVAVQQLGGDGVWIAVVQAGGIGLLIGSLVSGKARPRRPVLVGNLVLATYALPLTLFAVSAPVPFIVAAYALALAALGFLNPTWQTAVQARIPASVLGRVSSYDLLLSVAAQPLGVVAAPLAAAAWGVHAPFAVTAALVLVCCAGTLFVPGVRRLTVDYADAKPAPEPVADDVEQPARAA